jgi:hypothetical protein
MRRRWVWSLLIIVNILGIGPLIKGYAILDETLTYLLALGCLMPIALRGDSKSGPRRDAPDIFEEKRRWVLLS